MPRISQGWEQAKLVERELVDRSGAAFSERLSLNKEISRALTDWPSLQDVLAQARALAPRPSTVSVSQFRRSEVEWLVSHWAELKQYENEWVAIEGNRIIAHGPSEVEVDREARSQGIVSPFAIYVPSENEVPFIGRVRAWL